MQNPDKRLLAVPNFDDPMGPMLRRAVDPTNATIDLEWLAPPIPLLEAHDSLGGNKGAFCYIYV
jgi:tyrosinase